MKNPVHDKLTSSDKRKIEQKIQSIKQKRMKLSKQIYALEATQGIPIVRDQNYSVLQQQAGELHGEVEELDYAEEFLEEVLEDVLRVLKGGNFVASSRRRAPSVNERKDQYKSNNFSGSEGFRIVRTKK